MFSVLPEPDVLDLELSGSRGGEKSSVFANKSGFGVFSTAEEKVEADDGEISNGLLVRVRGLPSSSCAFFWDCDWNGKLWDRWRVLAAEALNATFNRKYVFSRRFVDGTWFASQVDGLADGRKRVLDRLNSDLISEAVSAGPDAGCKAVDDDWALDGGDFVKEGVNSTSMAIFAPVCPVFFVGLGSLVSDSSCCGSVRKQEVTRDAQFVGRVDSVQEPCCRGKWVLKKDVRLCAAWKNLPCLKARDAMSAMVFAEPAMLTGMSEDVWRKRCRTNRKRSRCAAAMDLLVCPLWHHATAEVLSQKEPMWAKRRLSHAASRTSHPMTRPASSRSLMVRVPVGLADEISESLMSCGHSYCHTM